MPQDETVQDDIHYMKDLFFASNCGNNKLELFFSFEGEDKYADEKQFAALELAALENDATKNKQLKTKNPNDKIR